MRHWLLLVAILVVLVANALTVPIVLELWNTPRGTGIRPMGLPMAIIFYGCGTPLVVITFVVVDARQTGSAEPLWQKIIFRLLATCVCVTALVPLVLTTWVAHWIIDTRDLWLKP